MALLFIKKFSLRARIVAFFKRVFAVILRFLKSGPVHYCQCCQVLSPLLPFQDHFISVGPEEISKLTTQLGVDESSIFHQFGSGS